MEHAEKEGTGRFIVSCLLIMAACFLLGSWYATAQVAKECNYHELLGYGISIADFHIYFPFAFFLWENDPQLAAAIPDILRHNKFPILGSVILGGVICYMMGRSRNQLTSHGTARFAKKEDIKAAGLDAKKNGVVVGTNPFTKEIMLHDGPEHIFLAAPTRSGKGVGIIIPTAITWHFSAFFFDPKQELWIHTAGYRKRVLRQKVIKFEPLCSDDSGARWNPYAEIDFRGLKEIDDTRTINQTIVKTDENSNKDPFWDDSAIGLLNGVTMHLLYKHYREGRPLPCPSDTISFLASPTMDKPHLFTSMKIYPHISPEEFLEEEYVDEATGETKKHRNPLKEIYGEYIPDLKPFKEHLKIKQGTPEWDAIRTLDDLRLAIKKSMDEGYTYTWEAPPIMELKNKQEIDDVLLGANSMNPFYQLLVHPKVAEEASKILGNAEQTGASIISSAQTPLNLYQDPLIKRNTCVSDFCFRDLLDPKQAVSLYLVIQPNDVPKLRPLTRLFVNTMLAKTVRDMKFDVPAEKKQRLLMMLDEFPQLKKLDSIENTLAICAGYGVKICTVVQSITQLNQIYTKDNSILDNSQVQIYMTPSNLAAAKELSEVMGDSTIKSVSRSDNGKVFGGSNSVSEQGRKLMNPDELLRMKKTKELVICQGCRPILCDKIRWFLEPFFKERVLVIPAPPYSDTCTEVKTYEQLFAVNAADVADMVSRQQAVAKARAKAAQKKMMSEAASPEKSDAPEQPAAAAETTKEKMDAEEGKQSAESGNSSETPIFEDIQPNEKGTPGEQGSPRAEEGARSEDTEAVEEPAPAQTTEKESDAPAVPSSEEMPMDVQAQPQEQEESAGAKEEPAPPAEEASPAALEPEHMETEEEDSEEEEPDEFIPPEEREFMRTYHARKRREANESSGQQ